MFWGSIFSFSALILTRKAGFAANGFFGGLVTIVLYAVILSIIRHRKPEIQNEDYFDIVTHDEPTLPKSAYNFTEEKD